MMPRVWPCSDAGRAAMVNVALSPGEAVVGYGLERGLGVHVGDHLRLSINGRRLPLRIVGRYAEGEDTGERAMITLADLRRVEPGADRYPWR